VRHRTPPQQQGPIRPRLWWWQTRPRHPRQGQWRTVVFSARAAVPPAVPATRDCLPLLLGLVEPLVHHLLDQGDGLSRASPQPLDPSHRSSGTPKGPSNRSFQFRHVIFVSRTSSRTGCVWFFLTLGKPVSYEIQSGARAYLLIDSLLGRRRPWFYLLTPRGRGGRERNTYESHRQPAPGRRGQAVHPQSAPAVGTRSRHPQSAPAVDT
jgi:hypothetical protein